MMRKAAMTTTLSMNNRNTISRCISERATIAPTTIGIKIVPTTMYLTEWRANFILEDVSCA